MTNTSYPHGFIECSTPIQEFIVFKTSKKWILMFRGSIVWKTKYDQEIFEYIVKVYPNIRKAWLIIQLGELADREKQGRGKKR